MNYRADLCKKAREDYNSLTRELEILCDSEEFCPYKKGRVWRGKLARICCEDGAEKLREALKENSLV